MFSGMTFNGMLRVSSGPPTSVGRHTTSEPVDHAVMMMDDERLGVLRADVISLVLDTLEWAGTSAPEWPVGETAVLTLRSPELSDAARWVFPDQNGSDLARAASKITDFVHLRKSLLRSRSGERKWTTSQAEQEVDRPQSLLLFRPAYSLFDGAATPASDGFINDEYFPPWDTWLTMVRWSPTGYGNLGLLTWVPHCVVARVNEAMVVDPGSCLCWVWSDGAQLWRRDWGAPWQVGGAA
jgi:hypothetical protein